MDDYGLNPAEKQDWRKTVLILSAMQIILLAIAVLWGWWRNISWQPLRLPGTAPAASWVFTALILGIANSLSANAALNYFIRRGNEAALWLRDVLLLPAFKDLPLPACLWLALLSACGEEFSFRLILLAETGPLISSIIFGIMHGGHRYLRWYMVWAASLGGIFCLLVHLTGNLWPAIALHFSSNLTSFILLRRYSDKREHVE
ncbi:MAG: CPBP family intramembrane metalloprotease [bacterium]|nr:CPBP family intramembrane metalloprotease [bacterium]